MEDKRCPVFVEGKECGLPLTLLEAEVRKIAIYEVVTYKCSLGHRSYFLHEPRSSRRSTGAKRLGHAVEVRRPAGFANYHPPALPRGIYRESCSLSYCSVPQTWQPDAHRLMRDRHRGQILNRLRHHKKEDVSAAKTRRMTFGSIASRLFPARSQHKSLSRMNDEPYRPAGPTFCLARVSKRARNRTLDSVH